MKTRLFATIAVSVLALLSSCTNQLSTVNSDDQTITFFATTEQSIGSKASLDEDGLSFLWEAGEKIGVWATRPDDKYQYSFTNQSPAGPTGAFNGNYRADCEYVYAVYPIGAATDAAAFSMELPARFSDYQSGRVVSPMIALLNTSEKESNKQTYTQLYFQHLCGMVKVSVDNLPVGTSSLSWTNLGAMPINGVCPIIEENLTPERLLASVSLVGVTNASKTTTFSFNALEEKTDMVFYVPLVPGTYETGFEIKISNGLEEKLLGRSTSAQTVARAKIHRLPVIDANDIAFAEANNVDVITAAMLTATAASYTNFTGVTDKSSAVYAGNSAKDGGNIQLRSKNNHSGIVTTASGGAAKKITITWAGKTSAGNKIDVYGKGSAYSLAADLYNNTTQGTKLGSIVCGTSTELVVEGNYAFIGLRSNSGAVYCESIAIEWE